MGDFHVYAVPATYEDGIMIPLSRSVSSQILRLEPLGRVKLLHVFAVNRSSWSAAQLYMHHRLWGLFVTLRQQNYFQVQSFG